MCVHKNYVCIFVCVTSNSFPTSRAGKAVPSHGDVETKPGSSNGSSWRSNLYENGAMNSLSKPLWDYGLSMDYLDCRGATIRPFSTTHNPSILRTYRSWRHGGVDQLPLLWRHRVHRHLWEQKSANGRREQDGIIKDPCVSGSRPCKWNYVSFLS